MGRERINAQRSSSKGVNGEVVLLYVFMWGPREVMSLVSSAGRQRVREEGERR